MLLAQYPSWLHQCIDAIASAKIKKKNEKEILQWLFQIFKPGEMKTKTAGKA